VEIVADRGIHQKVGPAAWEAICGAMQREFAADRFEHGVILGVEAISDLLAKGLLRGLNFSTADLDGTFDRVVATGADVVQEPMDQSYGRDCAFRDPAGNMIRIIQAPG